MVCHRGTGFGPRTDSPRTGASSPEAEGGRGLTRAPWAPWACPPHRGPDAGPAAARGAPASRAGLWDRGGGLHGASVHHTDNVCRSQGSSRSSTRHVATEGANLLPDPRLQRPVGSGEPGATGRSGRLAATVEAGPPERGGGGRHRGGRPDRVCGDPHRRPARLRPASPGGRQAPWRPRARAGGPGTAR